MNPVLLHALMVLEMDVPGSSVASEAWEKVLVCSVVQHSVDWGLIPGSVADLQPSAATPLPEIFQNPPVLQPE